MKTWIIPLAVLMVVPALGAAAPIVVTPVPEQLVEGHTVFTVIENLKTGTTTTKTQFAAAVAVLVREASITNGVNERFPGVLWFNDQYLVDPVDNSAASKVVFRYPCTGSVMAVNAGGLDPRAAFHPANPGDPVPTYVESYMVTDPNDNTWNVDKWNYTNTMGSQATVWSVAIKGNDAGYNTPDDGVCNTDPYSDGALNGGANYPTPGATGNVKYNAVLFFYLEDLTSAGANKLHHTGAALPGDDASACETPKTPEQVASEPYFADHWPCPAGNDNSEGNSHPYNPFYGMPVCPNCVGRNNHGGSAGTPAGSTDAPPGAPLYSHATRNIDLYYSFNPAPLVRDYRLLDSEGQLAPFFCEDYFAKCIPGDL